MTLSFFIPCNPPKSTAQGSIAIMKRRDGTQFVGKMQTSKARATQTELIALFSPHRPEKAIEGPVTLIVSWMYPWRKSEPKRNRALGMLPCDTRPDVGNLEKMPVDIMTRLGFWHDDAQIFSMTFGKYWSDHPGIGIRIETYNHQPIPAQVDGSRSI